MHASKSFLERFALRESAADAIGKGLSAYAKKRAEDYLADCFSDFLLSASAEVAASFLGGVATACLRILLGAQNRLVAQITNVIRAPFLTAIRAADIALSLPERSATEAAFRHSRLSFAIDEFERALSFCSDADTRNLIMLYQGLCARETPGGLEYARIRLSVVADAIEEAIPERERLTIQQHERLLKPRYKRRNLKMTRTSAIYEHHQSSLCMIKLLRAI